MAQEYHCRIVAEHLAKQHRVEVVTTCATDYITWKNDHPPGTSSVGGVTVHRFRGAASRDPIRFGRLSQKIFGEGASEKGRAALARRARSLGPVPDPISGEASEALRLFHLLQLPLTTTAITV